MTASPTRERFGVSDGDLPTVQVAFRLPISWMRAVKSRALAERTDISKMMRSALADYADKHGIDLTGVI